MGLRIIDRPPKPPPPSEADQLAQLEQEMTHWSVSRGGLDREVEEQFLRSYRQAKLRRGSDQDIFDLASQIGKSIRAAYVARSTCHAKVDVATLMALL